MKANFFRIPPSIVRQLYQYSLKIELADTSTKWTHQKPRRKSPATPNSRAIRPSNTPTQNPPNPQINLHREKKKRTDKTLSQAKSPPTRFPKTPSQLGGENSLNQPPRRAHDDLQSSRLCSAWRRRRDLRNQTVYTPLSQIERGIIRCSGRGESPSLYSSRPLRKQCERALCVNFQL